MIQNDYTQLQGRVFDDYVLDQLVYWIVIGLIIWGLIYLIGESNNAGRKR